MIPARRCAPRGISGTGWFRTCVIPSLKQCQTWEAPLPGDAFLSGIPAAVRSHAGRHVSYARLLRTSSACVFSVGFLRAPSACVFYTCILRASFGRVFHTRLLGASYGCGVHQVGVCHTSREVR